MDLLRSDKELYDSVVNTISQFSLELVKGVHEIVAERDSQNNPSAQLPAVLPHELGALSSSRKFSDSLKLQKSRLLHRFSEEEFLKIDSQFRLLMNPFREDEKFKTHLLAGTDKMNSRVDQFKESWKKVGTGYELLEEYCGGLASVMAGTASVESDFSRINWTKDPHSTVAR